MKYVAALLWLSISATAQAQTVRLVVPFPPAGVTDLTARLFAKHLAMTWKQEIIVVNVPGGGGTTGTLEVLRAPADGRTMMMSATGQGTQNPAIERDLPYRWDEPTLVARVTTTPLVFVVSGTSSWTNLKAALADIGRDPGNYRYGTSGTGGAGSIALARLLTAGGADWARVGRLTFQGGAPILEAVVDGRTQFAAQYLAEMKPLLAAGKLKPLAVSTETRAAALPQVPTGAEAGYPAFNLVGWTGIAGPANLPATVIQQWDAAVRDVTATAGFRAELETLSAAPAYLGPAAFKAALKQEYEEALAAAQALGLRR
jgi:tripartite-type tricarboxylate transporter receptor subunit TctC